MSDGYTHGATLPESQIRINSRLVPILVALLVALQLAFPYRGWVIMLVGLGGAWLISYLWARSLLGGLQLTREMRFGWAQVGDRLQERFTLTNQGWAPALWAEIIDHSTMPDYRASAVRYAGGFASTRWQTDGICTRRGLFTLGPTSVRTGDPFGLYTIRLHYPDSMALMVTPPIIPLPSIEVTPGGRAGEGQRPQTNAFEHTVSAAGVRDYRPGEDLRWIHWPVSAHRDALVVRVFDNTPASNWWVVLDLDQRVQVGEGWDSTVEHGVTLAASLASRGLRSGRSVGLATHGETLTWIPPQGGEGQRLAVLQALAQVRPGTKPLRDLLREGGTPYATGRQASLIIITAAAQGDWIEALLPLIRRGVTPTVLLLDPVSYGGEDNADRTLAALARLGVARYIITRDLLDRPEARPGRQGQWEWRVIATGHVVPVRRPRETMWKRLT
jgi:uncharacterized protein (DUF58 family)